VRGVGRGRAPRRRRGRAHEAESGTLRAKIQIAERLRALLTPRERLVAVLHYCDGLALAEVAAVLEVDEGYCGAVLRSALHKAEQLVRAKTGQTGRRGDGEFQLTANS
jgi:DNA-directed RNA polymerase specialized sigma24 family protein